MGTIGSTLLESTFGTFFSTVYTPEQYPTGRIGFDVIGKEMLVSMGINLVFNGILRFLLANSSMMQNVPKKKQKRTVLFLLSSINAMIGASLGVHHYWLGGSVAAQNVLTDRAFHTVTWISGYIWQDLIMIAPDYKIYGGDIFHHFSVLFLGFVGTRCMPIIYMILPAFALQELSTPILNLMWFAKEYDAVAKITPQFRVKQIFAILFAIFRVVWFPLVYYRNFETVMEGAPGVAYGIWVFCGLQFYWFFLIVRKAISASKQRIATGRDDAGNNKSKTGVANESDKTDRMC